MDVYWYVSSTKIQMLRKQSPLSNLKNLSVNLKTGWLDVGASFKPDDRIEKAIREVEKSFQSSARPFELLADGESCVFLSFAGPAARLIDGGIFFMASSKGATALLLVGSSSNATGGPVKDGAISPSADPIGACRTAFESGASTDESLPSRLCYPWQEVMRRMEGSLSWPRVEGLAVFAGMFAVPHHYAEVAAGPGRLVVGSPIFVRQTGT